MKKSLVLLCLALSTGVGAAAQAADNGSASCTQLSSDITARSALFVQVASAAPEATEATSAAPADALQRLHDKELSLRDIANEIWSLRTRMAYLDCSRAKTFTY